jgi:hypothetical protein
MPAAPAAALATPTPAQAAAAAPVAPAQAAPVAAAPAAVAPLPQPGETHAAYVQRAHAALASAIPYAMARNAAVLEGWLAVHGGDPAEVQAGQHFGDRTRYHQISGLVPVFKEHDYPRPVFDRATGRAQMQADGQPAVSVERYDFNALAAICGNMNARIADTGDFAPITDRHTPRPGSPEQQQPQIVGFSGPFYLGQVGNVEPRWAILAREHWFSDQAAKARQMPRRSAEVYLGRPIHERVLDPISALGAEPPALDMGVHYQQRDAGGNDRAMYSGPACWAGMAAAGPVVGVSEAGADLAQYSAGAAAPAAPAAPAAMPGATNVRPPTVAKMQQQQPAKPPAGPAKPPAGPPAQSPAQQEQPAAMITPEDIDVIVKALFETPPFQWVMQQMQGEQAENATGAWEGEDPAHEATETPEQEAAEHQQLAQASPPPPAPAPAPHAPPAMHAPPPAAPAGLPMAAAPRPPAMPAQPMPPRAAAPAAAGSGCGPGGRMGYSQATADAGTASAAPTLGDPNAAEGLVAEGNLRAQYSAALAELQTLRQQQAETLAAAERQRRASMLQGLRASGYPVDPAEELQRCGLEAMTAPQFDQHLQTIARYAAAHQIPVGQHVIAPTLTGEDPGATGASTRGGAKTAEPDFCQTEEFRAEVQRACYAAQNRPDYNPSDTTLYSRVRSQVIERRLATASAKTVEAGGIA